LELFLTPLQFVYLFCNQSKCILLFFSCTVGPWLTNSIRSRGLVVIQVGCKSRLFFP
jgi:hypothetical protein